MKFRKAWKKMLKGKKVRRPFWKGYWAWENGTIMMHLREGGAMDIRDTDHVAYTFDNIAAKDWEIVDEAKEQQASRLEVIGLEHNEETAAKKKYETYVGLTRIGDPDE